jgi:hypothetical protein
MRLAAASDEVDGLLRADAGLLLFQPGIDLDVEARAPALLFDLLGQFLRNLVAVDRLDDIVISTDDYELYRSRRGAFLPLLQAHLSSMSMLFIGLSLSDPNIRHRALAYQRELHGRTA